MTRCGEVCVALDQQPYPSPGMVLPTIGIGKALAAELLSRGARVTILARTEAKLKQAVSELSQVRKISPVATPWPV